MKKIFFRLLRKTGILKRLRFYPDITVNNRRFTIPLINEVGFQNYLEPSEAWMQTILEGLICRAPEKTFIDVGANLGQTLIKVKAANPQTRYIGFEPNPLCVNYLHTLIRSNNFVNAEIIPVGISDRSTVLSLGLYGDSPVDSTASIVAGFRDPSFITRTMKVPVFKYSDISTPSKFPIGIIKINAEGAEWEIMNGFRQEIIRDRPIILAEVLPAYHNENFARLDRQHNIERLLADVDYRIFRIIKNKDTFIGVQAISEFGIYADLNLSEYVLAPKEEAGKIQSILDPTNESIPHDGIKLTVVT